MDQFVILIYQGTTPLPGTAEWDALPQNEQTKVYADYAALNQTTGVSPGPPLGLPADARTVVVKDGTVDVRDGAHLGTDGAVGGFLVLEADDLDAAIELASRIPAARLGGAIEVRPVAKYW
ncbi:MAG TPA: YciI family protein [Acidimicrobiia bacterium]|jgi:hypothetical protein